MGSKKRRELTSLTFKHLKFCREFLRDLNASQAGLRAGFKSSSAGAKLLKDPLIMSQLEVEFKKRQQRLAVDVDRVVQEYAKLAFSNISRVANVKRGSLNVKDTDELSEVETACISELAEGKEGVKIKLHDKKGALDSVARHLGMFNDRLNLNMDKPLVNINKGGKKK